MRRLEVPFEDREAAKVKGARWNSDLKKWECKAKNEALYRKYQPVYLEPPYSEKDRIKKLGANWDSLEKKWVIASYKMNDELQKYVNVRKIYLSLPFDRKDEAKENKAKWDSHRKKWYFLSFQMIPETLIDYVIEDNDDDSDDSFNGYF
jgi:DNA topoisomerase-3